MEFSDFAIASRWKMWAARLFGKRVEGRDSCLNGDTLVVSHFWRGKFYIWDIQAPI